MPGGTSAPANADTVGTERGVPYLTLRNRTDSTDPKKVYGDNRSTLKAGWCGIGNTDLSVLTPLAEAVPVFIPEELLRVVEVAEKPPATVFDRLKKTAGNNNPVLYIHGYYVDFEKGCRRATVFQENTDLVGQALWFSWPSDGELLNYTGDESDLYWSVPDFAAAITELERRFGARNVNLAAHSLGARGLVLALAGLAIKQPDTRLGNVVLLAPDMDFGIFQKILPTIRPIAESITVYVSDTDRPLALSAQVHGYARLGETGNDVASLRGVEVIDLSNIPVRSPTGHLYHVYNEEVGADLRQLLHEDKRAAARSNLVKTGPNLWALQPEG